MLIAIVALVAGAAGAGVALWSTSRETEDDEAKEEAASTVSAAAAQTGDSAASKISEDSARVLALAQVPGGKVESGELETEGGKLLYSFDIKVPGKAGIEEIHIGAMTGEVLSHEHESDAAEASEKAKESGKAKKGDA